MTPHRAIFLSSWTQARQWHAFATGHVLRAQGVKLLSFKASSLLISLSAPTTYVYVLIHNAIVCAMLARFEIPLYTDVSTVGMTSSYVQAESSSARRIARAARVPYQQRHSYQFGALFAYEIENMVLTATLTSSLRFLAADWTTTQLPKPPAVVRETRHLFLLFPPVH